MYCLAQAATDVLEGQPQWMSIVYAAVTGLITMFLLPYLKRLSEKARAEADAAAGDAKQKLLARVKEAALDGAQTIAEEKLPRLAASILAKKMNADAIKAELRSWGNILKESLRTQFRESDGIDLLVVVGDSALDNIVRWAADKTSPFPGKETAVALLQNDWTNRLVNFGVNWCHDHWLDQKGN